jgi:transcriptional/translational regulatory protein YebC/TACO1
VAFSFASKGIIHIESSKVSEEKLMEIALDAGAEDVADNDGAWQVTTEPAEFLKVKDALTAAGIEPAHAEVAMQPMTTVACDAALASKIMKLIETLEDNDDVQKVFHNADIDEAVLAKLT